MAQILIGVEDRGDVANALNLKCQLKKRGVILDGVVTNGAVNGELPESFLEDMLQLRVLGGLKK